MMRPQTIRTIDRTIAVFALCLAGLGWGLIYLIVPAFGLLVLAILTIKLIFRMNTRRRLPIAERNKLAELFRLMRNNPVFHVKTEWLIQLSAFLCTVVLLNDVAVAM